MLTVTEETRYLGQMLTATSVEDRKRLCAIISRLAAIVGETEVC